jgi:hypothetical protein
MYKITSYNNKKGLYVIYEYIKYGVTLVTPNLTTAINRRDEDTPLFIFDGHTVTELVIN